MKRSHFWTILASHCALLIALGLSLSWNLEQASSRGDCIRLAYAMGFKAGGAFVERALMRAEFEEEEAEKVNGL